MIQLPLRAAAFRAFAYIMLACLGLLASPLAWPARAEALVLHARSRVRIAPQSDHWLVVDTNLTWNAGQTAIVICDMWDRHWCRGATARVAEMAPRMNEVLTAARARGVLIVHAPSETMKFYSDWPQRQRARQAPKADATRMNAWRSLDRDKEPPLPIDDSDGGCDDEPPCKQGMPWQREIATLEVAPQDVVSDSGEEIDNVFRQAGIENVIVLGVHANMCVLGRSFAIRSLVGRGYHVLLMRDLTDTMYNSRSKPRVPHFTGTDLIVEHIEKYWCPSVTSADFLGGEPFRFPGDHRPTIALVIGENEYHTWETLPQLGRDDLLPRGFRVSLVMSSPDATDPYFADFRALKQADLVVVSARRRTPPRAMIDLLRAHLAAGKPLLGIRTACHAFAPAPAEKKRLKQRPDLADWEEFDPEVLGGHYTGHYSSEAPTKLTVPPGAASHPILEGVRADAFEGKGSLYKTAPLRPDTTLLLTGSVPGKPPEPVAWIRTYGPGAARIFYTSLGHPGDFEQPEFRRLLLNAVNWLLAPPPGR